MSTSNISTNEISTSTTYTESFSVDSTNDTRVIPGFERYTIDINGVVYDTEKGTTLK